MKRILAAAVALALPLLVAGCNADDEPSAGPSDSPTDSPGSAEGGAGEVENETYPRGADIGAFCDVLAEIDDAIDEAHPGSDGDWKRILAAFEGLDALGVPDDLPETAVSELAQVELVVQASGSVEEFTKAVEQSPPSSSTMDDYIDAHC